MCCLSPGIARVPILYHSLQFSTVLYGCGKEYHCGSVENIKENQMRHCCARRSVLSSSLMVLFEIFDPYGEQFLETSTEKTALQLPKKQPWTRLMHKQILSIPFGNICLKMFNQCNIFLFTRKRRTPAATTVAVLNFYTIGSHLQRHKKWYEWRWNLQIKTQVPVNIGCVGEPGCRWSAGYHHNGSFTCACGFPPS